MRAAVERRERRINGTPAARADLAFNHGATLGKHEIWTRAAGFVSLWLGLIPGGGLRQLFLVLRLVFLGLGSCGARTGGGGDNAHCLDETPPRRSGTRHGCLSLAPWLNDIQSGVTSQ